MYRAIDLFAGIGGIRRGFDNAFGDDIDTVFVSEWDEPAQKTYKLNYPESDIAGDITKIPESSIPEFDICLAGFPCQAFSMAGKHGGFEDDYHGRCRGTLFLDVARICEYHKPKVIFCENVKGLTIHDKGKTYKVIKKTFEDLGYDVFEKVLNSKDFGVPQNRERIYIVCFRKDLGVQNFSFPEGDKRKVYIKDILDNEPIPSKYYLSTTYMDTLIKHRARHESKGNGFGYEIRPLDGIAGTIVCGGMGRERNLIVDHREHSMMPTTHITGEINKDDIRKMTPREWARLQGFPDEFRWNLADTHMYKQFGNSVTVNVIEAIAKEIRKVLDKGGKLMANRGEWGEPYVALRVLGDRRLYIADKNGEKNQFEWMDVLELIRHEAIDRVVTYRVNDEEDTVIEVFVNEDFRSKTGVNRYLAIANKLAQEIKDGKGRSFEVSDVVQEFLKEIEMQHIKAKSIDKSDLFLSIKDPRAAIVREHVGFSVKSEFGKNPTLFNTAKASAVVYKIDGMTDKLMDQINLLIDSKGNVAVSERCDKLLESGCKFTFVGFPYAQRAKCEAFRENLDLIDPRLPKVIERMLWYHFFEKMPETNLIDVTENIIVKNPCRLSRPEVKYVYMMKSFLYASYCGMTASTLWNGDSQVNGGFIKVSADGEVIAHYALESDAFKSYLYKNCYLEFPSTDEGHGNYAKVYKENDEYYFRLNFQIRYR